MRPPSTRGAPIPSWVSGTVGSPVGAAKRAIVAVGRSILIIAWHLLSDDNAQFRDLGPDYYDSRINLNRKMRNHVRELQALGYRVTLETAA